MMILPAIDLKDGRCVRLVQGKLDQATVYDADPLGMANAGGLEGLQPSKPPCAGDRVTRVN
jgi:phosphoribosylformimino-5-aminoimidazole carboxamide ribotide isomerase